MVARWSRSPGSRPAICPGPHWKVAPPKGERDPSHKGVHLPVGVLGTPLPPAPAPLALGAIGSATPSTPAGLQCDCSRCAGLTHAGETTSPAPRPFRCFQCEGPHGPRSVPSPIQLPGSAVSMLIWAREGKPLHAINNAVEGSRPAYPSGPPQATTIPQPSLHQLHLLYPQLRGSTPGMPYSAIATGNRFAHCRGPGR
ncbi:hypothetical protein GWK47_018209 [Chionoecetes opilio]|uniref:Uncharacterized protein n=1 Tax=Chionoecetes opilio TaxID=41210 RepID=A0A8J4XVG2_CHIOP|nr:hypothetical protein GWK47_018209 [Chionoecetes opilio]